ncbi:serine hydrolase domain-containing protein [Paenibacillus sp. Marseille-Q4541]|uniref:serine hydrolase domain-containing protein n=1 Tax=Paenibacillus sp. Marseille-Q4541 TaxID=2831522 RepID=UPI001BA62030|nr:serine hydrolase domain-containing protein [Paenibacillus sp. Marseille-Q4541]
MRLTLEEQLNHVIRPQDFLVGGAVVVVKDSQVMYGKGFGKARIGENERDFTPDTIISIQSISKSFTAASLLHLVEKGMLELDAPVVQYLPYFQTTEKRISNTITVRQLLSHTAGFAGDIGIGYLLCTNAKKFREFDEVKKQYGVTDSDLEKIKNREDITKFFKSVPLSHAPGTDWSYCTDAYMIAADLYEKVSGQRWDKYIEDVLFKKLDLKRTTLHAENIYKDENSALYYCSNQEILHHVTKPNLDMDVFECPYPINSLGAPMGFIYSTANDLGKYLSSYMSEAPFISQAMMNPMYEPVWHFDRETGYGLGWGTREEGNLLIIEHGGGFHGISAYVCMVPSERLGVVVVSNHDETPSQEICYTVLDTLLQK